MTSSEKRQRHKEGHRSRMELAHAAAVKARRRNLVVRVLVVLLLVAVGVAVVALLAREDPPDDATDTSTTTDETLPDTGTAAITLPPGPDGVALTEPTDCPPAGRTEERVSSFVAAPPTCIDESLTYEADMKITRGEGDDAEELGTVTIALDTTVAPRTVNNFVVLSQSRFYDGIPFHRLVDGFVAQAGGTGEPDATGLPDYATTGPGYDGIDGEYPVDSFQVGDVAMARATAVSGSQFFIVTGDERLDALNSAGNYPRFGRVTAGLDLVQQMTRDSVGEEPTELYTIESLTIRES